ncbi:MAG: glycosyltransferase [Anaerolineales bacterium]|nr:glycosyltransferase [Anaerolineales bacterium]
MNLVIATPYLPYPGAPHGGGADLLALIEFLRPRHAVRVLAFVDAATAPLAQALRPLVTELRLVRPAVTLSHQLAQAWAAGRAGAWRALGRRAAGEVRAALAAWAAAGQLDVLYCAWTEMGRWLPLAPRGAVRVLDEVDLRWRVEWAAARARPWRWLSVWRRRQQERAYLRLAELVVVRSARDARWLAGQGAAALVLPPVAHTRAFLNIPPELSRPGRVLFVGALDRARNQAAARWLVEAVWPRVRAACPSAALRLVGARPPPALLALSARAGVTATGYVPDLAAEYAAARVVAAPLLGEAGALNKVLDGLAAARPVVATRAANAGVGAPPAALTAADEPRAFAQAVIHLLTDDAAWARQSEAARAFARASFDWEAAAARLEAELERRRAGKRGAGETQPGHTGG